MFVFDNLHKEGERKRYIFKNLPNNLLLNTDLHAVLFALSFHSPFETAASLQLAHLAEKEIYHWLSALN